MATEAAGEPAAAPPPDVGSAAERAARGDAPIKLQYVRSVATRVHVGAVSGGRLPAAAAQATAVGDAQPRAVEGKSKKQAKKDRQQQRFSTAELCTMFALGKCQYSDSCRFNHDVAAYLEAKPAELPGSCPFSAAERCPFGVTCRWASKHAQPDALTQQYVIDRHAQAQAEQHGQPAAEQQPASVHHEQQAAAGQQQGEGAQALQEQQGQDRQAEWWWRQDGTIPGGVQELPVSAVPPVQEAANTLSKDLQLKLRKQQYDFSAADALLDSMGVRNTQLGRGQGGRGGRGGKGGRGGRRQAGRGPGTEPADQGAAAQGSEAAEPPSKRQKVAECRGSDTQQAAAAGANNDAAFVDGLGAPADMPAAAAVEAAAGTAVGVAAAAGGDADGTYVEAKAHRREKRQLDFSGKLFLAPLTTVGNLPFRRLCKSLGADVTCGEMALATNLLQGQPSEWALLKRHPSEDCFGVQLCGGYPDAMARCAQLIEETCSVDFVDLNFGCPIDVVCSKGAGSACLLKPQRMEQIVRTMSAQLSCPLTFKMRKGYNDGQDIAHTLVPKAAGWGASAITLHGRTREQRYSRLADWPYIKRCVDAAAGTGIQVIGNGDVFSFEDHYKHLEECPGLATTYIARGALIKPWLFTEIKEQRHWDISAGERFEYFKRFCSYGLEHWGSDTRGVESTRRFLLEWLSFTHRYIPVGLLEVLPQRMHHRPPPFVGRTDLETLLASDNAADWVAISEMLLGPAPPGFVFTPKHKANSYASRPAAASFSAGPAAGGGGGAAEEEEY